MAISRAVGSSPRRRGRSRRQRLVLRTTIYGGCGLIAILLFLLLKPEPDPYIPGEEISGLTTGLTRTLPADYPRVEFVDVAQTAGVAFRHFHGERSMQLPEDMGSGAAWADFDNDGRPDLFAVNIAAPLNATPDQLTRSPAHNALYHNEGNGIFSEIAASAGVDFRGCGQAAAWGDIDSDGFVDLVVTNFGSNLLYKNRGDATFAEISAPAGLTARHGFWAGASWGDYDRDGDLDLYINGYVRYAFDPAHLRTRTQQYDTVIPASLNPSTYAPEANLLYENDGGGLFEERAHAAGVANGKGRSLSASWSDFDSDGWVDLYVANDLSDNAMFRNRGDGTFADISHAAWVADYRGAMGLAVGDWDADGDQDLFVTHWLAQENAFYNNMHSEYRAAGMDTSSARLRFMDVADQVGLGQVALDYVGWGTAFLDYDNDGWLDLLVVNGSTMQQVENPRLLVPMRNLLFWNRGSEDGFFEVGAVSGAPFLQPQVGRGLAIADYDSDGDMDAFVVINGGTAQLLRNDSGGRSSWVTVRLKGAQSNLHGLHAKVRVVTGSHVQYRESGAASSYYSQHNVGEELFGLGNHTSIDTLEVRWPSGQRDLMVNLAIDGIVDVVEGCCRPSPP